MSTTPSTPPNHASEPTPVADEAKSSFGRPTFRDVIVGLVTGLFSIPEGMAYASIGNFATPLGLWSGAVPTIIGSIFSRTVLMITTLTSAIVLTAGNVMADAGLAADDVGAIATMTLMVGFWMLLFGVLRLGSVMSFVSTAVMTGFTAGIALQIVAGVIKDATGYTPDSPNTIGKFVEAGLHVGDWDGPTVAVASATVVAWLIPTLIKPLRKTATLISLVVVTLLVWITQIDVELASDIAPIPRSLPPFTLPDLGAIPELAVGSFAVALVALAQSAGIGAAVPNPDGSRTDMSKDFTAQGLANVGGGLFGALPTGGSLSRTGVATSSGARTRWSGIFAGLWLILFVLLFGPVAGTIPIAAIGGLLLIIGGELVLGRVKDIRLVLKSSVMSSVAMVVTFLATTQLPLQQAIFIGAVLSMVLFAVSAANKGRIVELVPNEDGTDFTLAEAPPVVPAGRTTIVHYVGTGFFAEVNRLEQEWPRPSGPEPAGLVISLRTSADIPSATFLKSLDRLLTKLEEHEVEVVLSGVPADLAHRIDGSGLGEKLAGRVVDDSDGLIASLQKAYTLAEARRLARVDENGSTGTASGDAGERNDAD